MHWIENDRTDVSEVEAMHGGRGTVRTRLFAGTSRLPVRFYVWELGPGAGWGVHSHGDDGPQEEVIYCLEGTGNVTVDGRDVPMSSGDAVQALRTGSATQGVCP